MPMKLPHATGRNKGRPPHRMTTARPCAVPGWPAGRPITVDDPEANDRHSGQAIAIRRPLNGRHNRVNPVLARRHILRL